MTPHAAREMADRAFGFIAADEDLTGALLAASGADPQGLRRMAASPAFAGFLLDFLLEDDARVMAFAEAERIRPESVLAARAALDGPGEPWVEVSDSDWP